ncbi:MAG: ATP-binding protein [Janthinobacterium sp.]
MDKVMPVASSALRRKRLIWVSRRRCAKDRAQAEASLLRVALRKLLSNADRHAPQTQAIRVQDATLDDGCVHIVVSNAGELLPADEIPHLHQKYCRGHIAQRKPGAGLGLYWVQRIAVYPGAGAGENRAGRSEMPEHMSPGLF